MEVSLSCVQVRMLYFLHSYQLLAICWLSPTHAFRYGGGAFLIPYVLALIIVAIPLSLLELLLGQVFQATPSHVFQQVHPRWRGLGTAAVLVTCMTCAYYRYLA